MLQALFRAIPFAIAGVAAALAPAFAQDPPRFPCGTGMVSAPPLLHEAAIRRTDVEAGRLRLTFIGHATFLIESPAGVRVVTDYNDNFRAGVVPDIATMNIYRGNHSTTYVEPGITQILRGWSGGPIPVRHDVRVKDVRVYSIPTNIEKLGEVWRNDSSIFVIQSAGLCVAHMGHLRHVLDSEAFSRLGRIDVLLLPVDGRFTQSYQELLFNLKGIRPRLIIPMHFNSMVTAEQFVGVLAQTYPVKRHDGNVAVLARDALPVETEVMLMTPGLVWDGGGGFGGQTY